MNGMKRKTLGLAAALFGVLLVPGIASAHTGFVTCDSTGVVFHYNANFERDTLALEAVRQGDAVKTKTVVVHRRTASTDTWPGVTGTVWAAAKWRGGGISWTRLVCPPPPAPPVTPPTPPTPPVTPPVTPPAPPVAPPATPPAPPVAPPVIPPTTPPVAPAPCPKGYKLHVSKGTRMCLRTVVKRPKAPKCPVGKQLKIGQGWVLCSAPKAKKGAKDAIHRDAGVTG